MSGAQQVWSFTHSSPVELACVAGYEFERYTVIAPALTCRLRTILEHMALMTTAFDAVVFGSRPDEFEIELGCKVSGDAVEKTRPAGSALVLHRRCKERKLTSGAKEKTSALFRIKRARMRALGLLFKEHFVGALRQTLAPDRLVYVQGGEWLDEVYVGRGKFLPGCASAPTGCGRCVKPVECTQASE